MKTKSIVVLFFTTITALSLTIVGHSKYNEAINEVNWRTTYDKEFGTDDDIQQVYYKHGVYIDANDRANLKDYFITGLHTLSNKNCK